LNFVNITDKNLRGMNPNGSDYTTYSMIIWDASNQEYSNNNDLPKGTTRVGSNDKANIYLVTQKGDKIYCDKENGPYNPDKATDTVASDKTMHSSFFIYGLGALWMAKPELFVTIELERKERKGYN